MTELPDPIPGQALPRSSLIIPSCNRPQLLWETVQSILSGVEVPTELIIIDQSDHPADSPARFGTDRECEIRHIHSRVKGTSRARNDGLRAARHDIIVFADDDMLAAPGWYGVLVRSLLGAGQRAVITGRVPAAPGQAGEFTPSTKDDETPAMYHGRIGQDVLFTGNMALYRAAFTEVGLFEERLGPGTSFPAAEDNDFGFRLLETGYQIHYVPEAVLYHRGWRPGNTYLRLRWCYGRGQGAYFAKHIHWRDRYMLRRLLRSARSHLVRLGRRLVRERSIAYAEAVYLAGLLSGAGQWLLTTRPTGRPSLPEGR
jgi:GT2 family glycosyltransferase